MASDGLYDYVPGVKGSQLIHRVALVESPKALLRAAMTACCGSLADDISILVLDIMPEEGMDFTERTSRVAQGVLRSFRGYLRHPSLYRKLKRANRSGLVADKDGLIEFPELVRNDAIELTDILPQQ